MPPLRFLEIKRRGLVVMGGDLCFEGFEFESQHRILDGHFSHIFVRFVQKDKMNEKRSRMAHF